MKKEKTKVAWLETIGMTQRYVTREDVALNRAEGLDRIHSRSKISLDIRLDGDDDDDVELHKGMLQPNKIKNYSQ